MARQLRHHHAGGWYHITSRGMGRQAIYADDADRVHFLDLLVEAVGRYGLVLHAYVLMDNHYHLLMAGMRHAPDERGGREGGVPQAGGGGSGS